MSLQTKIYQAIDENDSNALNSYLNSIRYAPHRLLTNKAVYEQAFIAAATKGRIECLRLLLPRVENLHVKGFEGRTALHEAARGGHLECVQALVSQLTGANLTISPQDELLLTPLMYAARASSGKKDFDDCLAILLTHTDVDTLYPRGMTVLFAVAHSPSNARLASVLEKTTRINHKDKDGRGVEYYAGLSKIKERQLATIKAFRAQLSGPRDGDLHAPPMAVTAPTREASTQENGTDNFTPR